jgi:hypothetical protein
MALAVTLGLLVGAGLAFLVALGNHYYWQMMLPGGALGVVVGVAAHRHRALRSAA